MLPVPELITVAEVLLVDPRVVVLTAPPVPILIVVAEASVEIDIADVPLFAVKAPPVDEKPLVLALFKALLVAMIILYDGYITN
jgi:hypothetical protein